MLIPLRLTTMSAASAGPRVFLDSVTEEILNPDDEVLLSGSNP